MKTNYFRNVFWLGFAIWLFGSWTGGWNETAQSALEQYTDFVGGILMIYGGVGDVLKGLKIYKDTSTTINAPNLKTVKVDDSEASND